MSALGDGGVLVDHAAGGGDGNRAGSGRDGSAEGDVGGARQRQGAARCQICETVDARHIGKSKGAGRGRRQGAANRELAGLGLEDVAPSGQGERAGRLDKTRKREPA